MKRIMIVEDDHIIAEKIKEHLDKWGYEAVIVKEFRDVLSEFVDIDPKLVLMDIGLPFYNGYHWCTEIRKMSNVPIIFLSSMSDNMNIVMAMNMGGDEFITKPFDLNVLTAKIQAMLRRSYSFVDTLNVIEHNGGILNINDQTFSVGGTSVELTRNEYRILQCLMESVSKIVSRDTIMEKLWQNEAFIDDNTLTVNVTRLRKKLEAAGLPDYIITKKGAGYMIK